MNNLDMQMVKERRSKRAKRIKRIWLATYLQTRDSEIVHGNYGEAIKAANHAIKEGK